MYKQVETDGTCQTKNKTTFTPVATLADEHGGRCQITIDDHCYVLYLKQNDNTYGITFHIFSEAFKVLKTLSFPK